MYHTNVNVIQIKSGTMKNVKIKHWRQKVKIKSWVQKIFYLKSDYIYVWK